MKIKIILVLLFVLPALPLFSQNRGVSSSGDRVVDNASLLSPGQKGGLMARLNSLAAAYNFDLVIVTEKTIDGALPMNYADDFFDNNGYGRDGCLFLIVTGTRDYWFSTSGRGIDILNPTAFGKLESDAVKSLRVDSYYAAFSSFLDNWEKFLILEAEGRSYNFFTRWNFVLVTISWLIALGTGLIVVQVWKSGMNTALPQTQAISYIVPGSVVYNQQTDSFLYSVVSKTARQTDSGPSSSGGSHTSSSGMSHGGGGGKY